MAGTLRWTTETVLFLYPWLQAVGLLLARWRLGRASLGGCSLPCFEVEEVGHVARRGGEVVVETTSRASTELKCYASDAPTRSHELRTALRRPNQSQPIGSASSFNPRSSRFHSHGAQEERRRDGRRLHFRFSQTICIHDAETCMRSKRPLPLHPPICLCPTAISFSIHIMSDLQMLRLGLWERDETISPSSY